MIQEQNAKQEQDAKLLQAYRAAIAAGQDGIADLLEEVILAEMGKNEVKVPVMRGIKVGDESLEPTWRVTCGPDVVPSGAKIECTGIDHLSKEATV